MKLIYLIEVMFALQRVDIFDKSFNEVFSGYVQDIPAVLFETTVKDILTAMDDDLLMITLNM